MNSCSIDGLEDKILKGFSYVYRANKEFLTLDDPYRHRCFEAIQDRELMKHIVFNNDYLKIPPVYTFLCYYAEQEPKLEPADDPWIKKSVGAFWGYVFRKVFGYENAHNDLLPGRKLNFRSASYFTRD
ncbi:MAG: hypothetical protein SCM11_04370 [Bacillota bacterium]|nr:hypothetical protein [Bacillota bacterium]